MVGHLDSLRGAKRQGSEHPKGVKLTRHRRKMTQDQLARLISSSQSRVAKMESGDPSVSIDLLIRSLLALGASKRELARVISSTR
jgi:transcriptional regulator with XRE-family HTH domain